MFPIRLFMKAKEAKYTKAFKQMPTQQFMPEKATYEQMLMEARKAGNVLQTSMIISEAAAKGIYLR